MNRIEQEKRVVRQMIEIYCRKHRHTSDGSICHDCSQLLAYAHARLSRCPHGVHKTSCRRCHTHCYSPLMREHIRQVMRFVGPRMMFTHPIPAIRHLISELR